ncbi:unnamed protein product [Echinostoma caproni]|uniref:Ribosomal_L18e/L15P domain-containing protein n=1 Tax=Echinostoma caproni TaxID=27848 RepID=A0A183AA47_9TREM|nr:unnamed protein product [Echinostoma caproni]
MEPSGPIHAKKESPASEDPDKRSDLTVPCVLLIGHVKRVKLAEIHVAWRRAVTMAFPTLTNLKPQVTTTWLVLRDRTSVTSVNLQCKAGSIKMGPRALLKALEYLKLDLSDIRPVGHIVTTYQKVAHVTLMENTTKLHPIT